MSFQVFISYARRDNQQLGGDGFVTYLRDRLKEQLIDLGAPAINLWFDVENIDETDPFAPILDEQIAASNLMLVVMSPNWLNSIYCKREVEQFAKRWGGEGEAKLRTRYKVVRKRPNDRNTWPAILQGQEGMAFFPGDTENPNSSENGYYWNGKERGVDVYPKLMTKLAGIIIKDAARLQEDRPGGTPSPPSPAPKPALQTLYLARPAGDMERAYERLARELAGLNYAVVPDRNIPNDETAEAFIDAALAQASVSVHLLGVKKGYAPPEVAPILQLQLQRAALRAKAAPAAFRRIVWAPKILEKDPPDEAPTVERVPMDVLKLFDEWIDGDKVDGQVLSKFVEFLGQNLKLPDPPAPLEPEREAQGRKIVYLCHEVADTDFAQRVAGALRKKQLQPIVKLYGADPQEVLALHHSRLKQCDAVAMCWAQSPIIKIALQTNEWKDWRNLQRERQFAYRALIKGPPLEAKTQDQLNIPIDEFDFDVEFGDDALADLDKLVPSGAAP